MVVTWRAGSRSCRPTKGYNVIDYTTLVKLAKKPAAVKTVGLDFDGSVWYFPRNKLAEVVQAVKKLRPRVVEASGLKVVLAYGETGRYTLRSISCRVMRHSRGWWKFTDRTPSDPDVLIMKGSDS